MGTQTAIAAKIRERKADYVLAWKGNQSALHKDVMEYFSDEQFCKEIEQHGGYTVSYTHLTERGPSPPG